MSHQKLQDLAEIGRLIRLFQGDAECIIAEQPDLIQLSDQDLHSAIKFLSRLLDQVEA